MNLKNISGNKVWLWCCLLFYLLITLFSLDVPFFWDSVTFSKIADHFFSRGFNGFILPETSDTGGFPLYGAYIAMCWTIFGKSLVVSHLAFLPFILGVIWEFYKLCRRVLPEMMTGAAMLLLMAEPCFATQSMLMAYDIILLYFMLLATNSLLAGKQGWYSVSLFFIVMISVRGLFVVPAYAFIHLLLLQKFRMRKATVKDILVYIPVTAGFICWIVYHKQHTGWYLLSPWLGASDQKIVETPMMVRQFIYILWKVSDFGRIALWIVLPVLAILFRQKLKSQLNYRLLIALLLLPLFFNIAFMIPLSNPVGHRYFMFTYIILIITVTYIIQYIDRRSLRRVITILLALTMISGNLWLWPEKYGNGWDCSLKVIPFFGMEKQVTEFTSQNQIAADEVATDFPLQADHKFTRLTAGSFNYRDKGILPIRSFRYILHSNISNKFRPDEMLDLQQNWHLIYNNEQWPVYIRIYRNPEDSL